MSGRDDEFDDFLSRRKPLFRRPPDDVLEPPEEVDRIVLRQARDAIEADRPQRLFPGTHWGTPLAIAATLLVTFSVVMHATLPKKKPVPEVSVQQAAQRVDYPPPAAVPAATAPAAEAPAATAARGPAAAAWRRDAQSWMAQIERLRAAGRNTEADAEMAEYKRQHRAYAVAPDR